MPKPIKSNTNNSTAIAEQCCLPMKPTLKKLQLKILKPTPTTSGKPRVPKNMLHYLQLLTNKTKAIRQTNVTNLALDGSP